MIATVQTTSAFEVLADHLMALAGAFVTVGLKTGDPLMEQQAAALRDLAAKYRTVPADPSLNEAGRKALAEPMADELMEVLSRNPTEPARLLITEYFTRLHAALRPAPVV